MANKWAIKNGNWSDGSTWDDGVVPTADDDVYCNGYTISLNVDTISFKTLSNKSDDNINYGGHIVYSRSGNDISIVGNSIFCNGTESIIQYDNVSYASRVLSFVCDIHNEENASVYAIVANNAGGSVIITGNIYGSHIAKSSWNPNIFFSGISYREIGNSPLFSLEQLGSQTNGILEIYGIVSDCVLESLRQMTQNIAYITIVGEYRCNEAAFFYQDRQVYKITLDGEIYLNGAFDNFNCINLISNCKYFYVSTNYKIGMNFERISNLTISNPDTFILKDITNPRTNPFIIITNAELNNRQQYPQESDVKNGVEYAYGLKEGNYTPNFPQEANVLKDVEYGDNQKGTLEVIALSGATATADNISVVNLTEQEVNRVKNCATVSTVQKCFEDFKEE